MHIIISKQALTSLETCPHEISKRIWHFSQDCLKVSCILSHKSACGDTAAKSFQFFGIEAAIDGPSWPGPDKVDGF